MTSRTGIITSTVPKNQQKVRPSMQAITWTDTFVSTVDGKVTKFSANEYLTISFFSYFNWRSPLARISSVDTNTKCNFCHIYK